MKELKCRFCGFDIMSIEEVRGYSDRNLYLHYLDHLTHNWIDFDGGYVTDYGKKVEGTAKVLSRCKKIRLDLEDAIEYLPIGVRHEYLKIKKVV